MTRHEYDRIRYDNPALQAEFEQLLQDVAAAEQARAPIEQRHRTVAGKRDSSRAAESEYEAVDREYISANNRIARAKKAVDAFLGRNKNYRVE